MKRYFLILFLLIPFSALSQKSLLTAPYSYRLVAHAFSKESRFGNQWSVIIGAGGMVKINDVFFIGAEYDYIIPMIEVPSPPNVGSKYLHGGYYGGDIGIILLGNNLFHILAGSMIGAGELSSNAFFVLEPRIISEINITDYIQLGFEVGCRFTAGVHEDTGIYNTAMSGFSFGLNVAVVCWER